MSETIAETKTRLQELVEIMTDPAISRPEFEAALEEWRELNKIVGEDSY